MKASDVDGIAPLRALAAPGVQLGGMGSRNRQGRKTLTGAPLPDGLVAELTTHESLHANPLSIVIFGATGDLAKKKLFPALYQLVLLGHLPPHLAIVGYGRKAVDLPAFVAKQCVNIKEQPALPKAEFQARVSFHTGPYDSPDSFKQLAQELTALLQKLGAPAHVNDLLRDIRSQAPGVDISPNEIREALRLLVEDRAADMMGDVVRLVA